RSSLAAVILRMKALGLTDVERFPFLDPPAPRMIADGYQLLAELGAVDDANELTAIGRQLARFPIDPRVARMILAAERERSLAEILVIAAVLEGGEARERPVYRAAAAGRAPRRVHHACSAFSRRELGFSVSAQAVGSLRRGASASEVEPAVGAGIARPVPVAAATARMARRPSPAGVARGRNADAGQ